MRHIRRDPHGFTRAHSRFDACEVELDPARQNRGDLFIMMAVLLHTASLSQFQPRDRDIVSMNHLPLQERIDLLFFDGRPVVVRHAFHFTTGNISAKSNVNRACAPRKAWTARSGVSARAKMNPR